MSCEMTIAELKPGDRVKVFAVKTNNTRYLRKLAALGILPGVDIELLQIKPTYVFKIGHAEIALDKEIAHVIIFFG